MLCGLSMDHKTDTVSVLPERLSLASSTHLPISRLVGGMGSGLWYQVSYGRCMDCTLLSRKETRSGQADR